MNPLYILMLNVHGLIRGHDLELGRDADTGGQSTYVLELARALGRNPAVERVDVLTRMVIDPQVCADYAQPIDPLSDRARIVRLPFGPRRYLRKELLWDHLDQLVDRSLAFLREQQRLPDIIHSHYADAGHVGVQLAQLLGIPLVHTSHSLGRVKRERLLAAGRKPGPIEKQFRFQSRIGAEEAVLEQASLVVTSTHQEIHDQYSSYDNFDPRSAQVIPPGTDTSRFSPPGRRKLPEETTRLVDRFLAEPTKPLILAIARPEARKNLQRLLAAYAGSDELRSKANLAVVAGNRDNVRTLEDENQKQVLTDLILDIDRYDLYGQVALPKQHCAEDVPNLYRLAARRKGVFVNPALTEPFGLTLIEAAASGLPIVATNDGGPMDIIGNCRNGLLVDPLDTEGIARNLLEALSNPRQWLAWSRGGIAGVNRHYTWDAHVAKYLKAIEKVIRRGRKRTRRDRAVALRDGPSHLPLVRNMLITDIDDTLLGDNQALAELVSWLQQHKGEVGFGIATGRSLESTQKVLKDWKIPRPDLLITSVGSEINYSLRLVADTGWNHHIRHMWRRDAVVEAMKEIPGLRLQAKENQREFKVSYNVTDPEALPSQRDIGKLLRAHGLHGRLIYSHQAYLDVLPIRASKGLAVRYLAYKWGLPLSRFLVAGGSGNDEEMLVGDTLGIVVGNHSPELAHLRNRPLIYFAQGHFAQGILEGIRHYRFGEDEL